MNHNSIVFTIALTMSSLSYAAGIAVDPQPIKRQRFMVGDAQLAPNQPCPAHPSTNSTHLSSPSNAASWTVVELDHTDSPMVSGQKVVIISLKELASDSVYALGSYDTEGHGALEFIHIADAWKDLTLLRTLLREAMFDTLSARCHRIKDFTAQPTDPLEAKSSEGNTR